MIETPAEKLTVNKVAVCDPSGAELLADVIVRLFNTQLALQFCESVA